MLVFLMTKTVCSGSMTELEWLWYVVQVRSKQLEVLLSMLTQVQLPAQILDLLNSWQQEIVWLFEE